MDFGRQSVREFDGKRVNNFCRAEHCHFLSQYSLGISGAQLFVLHEVGKTPALSLSDLAERTRTDQSSVSVVVSRLVEGGYITRERDRRDARRLVLTLTKNGRAIAEKSPPVAQEKI